MNLPADYAFRIARTVVTSDRTSYIDDLFSRGQLLAEVESHLCSDVNETAQRLHELTQDFAITPRDQQFTINLSSSYSSSRENQNRRQQTADILDDVNITSTEANYNVIVSGSDDPRVDSTKRKTFAGNQIHAERRIRHSDMTFTSKQAAILCQWFSRCKYVDDVAKRRLAYDLNMSPTAILVNIITIIYY